MSDVDLLKRILQLEHTVEMLLTHEGHNFSALNIGAATGAILGAANFSEIADPAAPAVNIGTLYVRDNGAGKTQLCVRFNTGAVQVIATQP